MAHEKGLHYIVEGVVTLFVFALLFPITYTELTAMNLTATLTAIVLGIEAIFMIGILYKLLNSAGIL